MEHKEKLTALFEENKRKEMWNFFKELSDKERKALIPEIKKAERKYEKYENKGKNWNRVGSNTQLKMVADAFFFCAPASELKYIRRWGRLPSVEDMDKFLEWHVPDWLSDYFNGIADGEDWVSINYFKMMEWTKKSYMSPSPNLIARTLVSILDERIQDNEFVSKMKVWQRYVPEKAEIYTETLDEHIWYLFQYSTSINWTSGYQTLDTDGESKITGLWEKLFKNHADAGRIDRKRVLKESIAAVNRNFDKNLTGWFADLFLFMEPTDDELMVLQKNINSMLDCTQSKPVNVALAMLKRVAGDKKFDVADFCEHLPVLLASEYKNILNSTLSVVEAILKKNKTDIQVILTQLSPIFLNQDEKLQTKAAKLIQKYGNLEWDELKMMLNQYQYNMRVVVKTMLAAYIEPQDSEPEEYTPEAPVIFEQLPKIREDNKIVYPETLEDLIFMGARAFENQEPYLYELFPASLLRLCDKLNTDEVKKMLPVVQKAYKSQYAWSGSTGNLDSLTAVFATDVAELFITKYPAVAAEINKLKEKSKNSYWHYRTLASWEKDIKVYYFEPVRQIFEFALQKIKENTALPLLSTPTHTPCYINPAILAERIKEYQQKNIEPNDMDLQLAILRCATDEPEKYMESINSLNGEYAALLKYTITGDETLIPQKQGMPEAWLTATYKHPENPVPQNLKDMRATILINAGFEFTAYTDKVQSYYATKGSFYTPYGAIKVIRPDYKRDSGLLGTKKPVKFIMEWFYFPHTHIYFGADWERIMYQSPYNNETFIADIINYYLRTSSLNSGDIPNLTGVMNALTQFGDPLRPIAQTFIAMGMLASDKTIRAYAAEVWAVKTAEGNLQSAYMGTLIGKAENLEYAPLKRFTDLITQNMMNVNNLQLEDMLKACIAEIKKPMTGLAKLLEVYSELLALNKSKTYSELAVKLNEWKENSTLKKVAKRLIDNL